MNFSVAILMQAIVTCTLSFVWKSLELAVDVEVVLGTNVYVPVREKLELKL